MLEVGGGIAGPQADGHFLAAARIDDKGIIVIALDRPVVARALGARRETDPEGVGPGQRCWVASPMERMIANLKKLLIDVIPFLSCACEVAALPASVDPVDDDEVTAAAMRRRGGLVRRHHRRARDACAS